MTARDPSASPAQRICPSCGHANSGISLFCAECGAVLNGASMDEGRSGAFDPSLTMSAASDPGQTQPIRSAAPEQDWSGAPMGSSADPGATAQAPAKDLSATDAEGLRHWPRTGPDQGRWQRRKSVVDGRTFWFDVDTCRRSDTPPWLLKPDDS